MAIHEGGRRCPICNSNDRTVLSEICGNLKIMGSHFPDTASNNAVCSNCGTVYVDTTACQADFDRYYESMAKTIRYAEAFGDAVTTEYFENILGAVEPYIDAESRILDLGSGVGEFSEFMARKGYKNVTAVDVSAANVSAAQQGGINAIIGNAAAPDGFLNAPAQKFDLIVFSHTLEHILDIRQAMQNVKTVLADGGILFIEVPDASKYSGINMPPYFFFTYEHLIHFTTDTLKTLSGAFGLTLIQAKSYLKCARYHVLYGIFRLGRKAPVVRETQTETAVRKYEMECCENLKPFIDKLEHDKEKLVLWGVGASTAQLLNGNFDRCDVVKLIDSNPARQGIEFRVGNRSLKIEAPATVTDTRMTIVVLPVMYKDSIVQQIQEAGLTNRIVTLASGS
jgi:2-polyprenyl-3-methyl-5-hydroxy-6-metoxy-1,4-benzoquinol methylase